MGATDLADPGGSRAKADGQGEVFIKVSKQGSTLAWLMAAFSIAISIGLRLA